MEEIEAAEYQSIIKSKLKKNDHGATKKDSKKVKKVKKPAKKAVSKKAKKVSKSKKGKKLIKKSLHQRHAISHRHH